MNRNIKTAKETTLATWGFKEGADDGIFTKKSTDGE